mgnify:FL=1
MDAPYLAIGFENGRVQLMRHETDEKPIILVTDMKLEHMEWNPFGTMLAISGPQTVRLSSGERKVSNTVEFYSPYGQVCPVTVSSLLFGLWGQLSRHPNQHCPCAFLAVCSICTLFECLALR